MRKHWPLLLLISLSIIPLLDLFHSGLPITHDGQDHVARIANFYQNLKEGILIPRWAGNLNWCYGHPILMFLYPMSSYAASLFHFIGFSLVDSVKVIFGLAFVLSGLTMYLWARNFFGGLFGFLVAFIYMFSPYRFVDLYVRGALGEHVAFIFPPLIFYFLLKLSKKYSLWYVGLGSLSLTGLILSHNAISIMFLPLILFYAGYIVWQSKNKKYLVLNILYVMLFGFGLAAFFWVPAFFEGKYTLRNIVTKGEYLTRFADVKSLVYGPWNYGGSGQFTLQIGIINLLALVFSLFTFALFRKKEKQGFLALGIIFYSLFVVFLMLPQSNFIWQRFMILQNFQFPWRFLSVLVFTTAVLVGFFLTVIPKKIKTVAVVLLILLVFWFQKDYWHANGYLYKSEDFYSGIYDSTTDTGESAPVWSVRFMEKRPKTKIELIGGNAEIRELERSFTAHKYRIDSKDLARIRENTLYFPGWNVFIDSKPTIIEFQDQKNRGLITFYVPKGVHTVDVIFKETKLRVLSNVISIASIFGLVGFLFYNRLKIKKHE